MEQTETECVQRDMLDVEDEFRTGSLWAMKDDDLSNYSAAIWLTIKSTLFASFRLSLAASDVVSIPVIVSGVGEILLLVTSIRVVSAIPGGLLDLLFLFLLRTAGEWQDSESFHFVNE